MRTGVLHAGSQPLRVSEQDPWLPKQLHRHHLVPLQLRAEGDWKAEVLELVTLGLVLPLEGLAAMSGSLVFEAKFGVSLGQIEQGQGMA